QFAWNQNGYNAVQNTGHQVAQNEVQNPGILNVGKQNGLIVVSGIANQNVNQNGNGNVVTTRAEGNGNRNNTNQIRCYNCRGLGIQLQAKEFDLMAAAGDIDEIEEVNSNCILMANLQQASSSEEQYTEILGSTTEPHLDQQNDINVILVDSNMEHSRGIGKEKSFEFNHAKFDELKNGYRKSVYQEQCLTKKINALHLSSAKTITTLNEEIANLNNQLSKEKSIVSYLQQEKEKLKSDFIRREDELFDKLIQSEKKIKELDNILVKIGQSIQTMHMLLPKPHSFYHTEQKIALGYQNPFYLKQAQKKQQILYNGKVLLDKHDPPGVYDLEETLQLAQESHLKMKQLNKEIKLANYAKINKLSQVLVSQMANSREEVYFSNTSKMTSVSNIISKSISIPDDEFSNDTPSPSVARKLLNEVKDTIVTLQRVVKSRMSLNKNTWSSLVHQEPHKILKNEIAPIVNQVDITVLEKENEHLLRAIASHDIMSIVKNPSVVDTSDLQTELEQCKYDKIVYDKAYNDMQLKIEQLQAQLGDPKGKSMNTQCALNTIDPLSQKLDDENVSLEFQVMSLEKENVHLKAIYKNLFESIKHTRTQTKIKTDSLQEKLNNTIYENAKLREQLHTKFFEQNDTVRGVESTPKTRRPHPRRNTKNDRLAIRNDKSEVVCASCKKCLITTNHDFCVFNYANGMNYHDDNQSSNVSNTANQKKHTAKVKKSKKLGSKERLASSRPRKPRTFLRWSPTGRIFNHSGKIIESSDSECKSDTYKFMRTVQFGNDHVSVILGYGDLQWGNILIARVYFVDGLGHNLFSVGQFCDSDLEVTFKRNTCFVRNLKGVDMLKGNRTTNLYIINLHEMTSASPICLMARAASAKSKDEAPEVIKTFLKKIQVLLQASVIIVRSDNGTEFINQVLKAYFEDVGILHQTPSVKTPQQNGVLFLWTEAIVTACYTQNRSLIHRRFNNKLCELINEKKSDISFLHLFEALCYPKNDREDIGKLGAKGDIGFFLGHSSTSYAYIVYNRRTKKIIKMMNVTFDELLAMAFEQHSSNLEF
ncbi:retrovirus-related pol polyprotein from transposon TNT 1-94, partial [Tanacetum coccineum]